jgi:hypothetical protein
LTKSGDFTHWHCCPNQPLLPDSRKVQSKRKAVAAAAVHPRADQEISQRESWGEEIFARLKTTRKKTTVASPMLVHSLHPVSMRGRRIAKTLYASSKTTSRRLLKPGRYTQNPSSWHFERNGDVTPTIRHPSHKLHVAEPLASKLRHFVCSTHSGAEASELGKQPRRKPPCLFRSPRNIYVATNRMKVLVPVNANLKAARASIQPACDILPCELPNPTQVSRVQFKLPTAHSCHDFNVCTHDFLSVCAGNGYCTSWFY